MSETDRRLKDQLNSNQAKRERMCVELLSVRQNYSQVEPRLPNGGPDGGRDMQAKYKDILCFGAVGFVNDASDTLEHRKQITKKFKDDLANSVKERKLTPTKPSGFVFFTNVNIPPTIKSNLLKLASESGVSHCEIIDREEMRLALDSNKGYATRFRYLDIPLTDAEQKDFFSTWADEINSILGQGISGIGQSTKRIEFLLESQFILDSLSAVVRLDRSLWEATGGNIVFQAMLSLQVESNGLISLNFGGGNDPIKQTYDDWVKAEDKWPRNGRFGYSFSGVIPGSKQHRAFAKDMKLSKEAHPDDVESEGMNYLRTFESRGILDISKTAFAFEALTEPFMFRFRPYCKLIELSDCMMLYDCNDELEKCIESITIYGNGYELLRIERSDWKAEVGKFERFMLPKEAHQSSDSAKWVTLRPTKLSSAFHIDLMSRTPRRYNWS